MFLMERRPVGGHAAAVHREGRHSGTARRITAPASHGIRRLQRCGRSPGKRGRVDRGGPGQGVNQRTTEVYQALLDGESPEVRSLGELQELVDEESAYHDSSDYEEDRSYWMERMAGAGTPPSLSLGPRQGEGHQVAYSGRISSDRRDALRTATRAALPVVVAAAVAVHLNRVTGESDIVLGVPLAARMTPAARGCGTADVINAKGFRICDEISGCTATRNSSAPRSTY